ncbi:MAG: hypothetical protein L0229_14925 [Blastocatellia bacterium]|nr:hypothetical protein [Blastocatellia bacterium]
MIQQRGIDYDGERGIALISALLVSTMLLALGLAVVLSATTDTVISKSHRVSEQAFFAADAGVAIARRSLATALQEEILKIQNGEVTYGDGGFVQDGTTPDDTQVLPDPDDDPDHEFYQNVFARVSELSDVESRHAKLEELNGTSFTVNTIALAGSVEKGDPVDSEGGVTWVEATTLRYSIQVTGTTQAGGRATIIETGLVELNLTLSTAQLAGLPRDFSFSGFGAFFDFGDTNENASLASGTFTGIVHTNTHFAFKSSSDVAFRNKVTQVDNYIRLNSNDFDQGHQSIPAADTSWIDISAEGYTSAAPVPLPENNFSQEYAVINGTGITDLSGDGVTPVDPPAAIPVDGNGDPLPVFDSDGRVTTAALKANLRAYNNAQPVISSGNINDGVYISSANGTSVTGAGIYVQGNADDIKLVADTVSGRTDQLYIITQGGIATTIRVNYEANGGVGQTTISRAGTSTTFNGVPTDKSEDKSDPAKWKNGASLFVNGTINSLRGGVDGSINKPAIASDTRLTVTAQRDIKVTGDLKYQDTVVNSDGTPVSNLDSIKNVFGIFTNDGNVELKPDTDYTLSGKSLEMHAAVVSFNSDTSNDDTNEIEGSITYTGTSTSTSDKWKLVGSRVQSKINSIAKKVNGVLYGYTRRDIFFDVRFAGGKFAPPFFPGTTYALGTESAGGEVVIANVDAPKATGLSWVRVNN